MSQLALSECEADAELDLPLYPTKQKLFRRVNGVVQRISKPKSDLPESGSHKPLDEFGYVKEFKND